MNIVCLIICIVSKNELMKKPSKKRRLIAFIFIIWCLDKASRPDNWASSALACFCLWEGCSFLRRQFLSSFLMRERNVADNTSRFFCIYFLQPHIFSQAHCINHCIQYICTMDTSLDSSPNPQLSIAQLQALVDNPSAFESHKAEIVRLSHKTSIAFESPFDTHHRIAYGVCHVQVGK